MADDLKFPEEDTELQERGGGNVDTSEGLRRKSAKGRVLRKGKMDALPEAMKPQPMDNAPILPPVSPAAQGNPMATEAATRDVAGPQPQRSNLGASTFFLTIDYRMQGNKAIPVLIKDGAKAFTGAFPAGELGVRLESGRKFLVTITETPDSAPKFRRLGNTETVV